MFGQSQYSEENHTINAALAQSMPLVAVHRGTGLGSIAENTQNAITAAQRQGAQMTEIDIVQSTDGEFFVFHDGMELQHFGIEQNIRTMTADQIRGLQYQWHSSQPYGVTPLADVLQQNHEMLFNVDRSWWFWKDLLPYFDQFPVNGRALLKSPPDAQWLDQLAAHPVKYAYAPMVHTHDDVLRVLDYEDINTIGMELVAHTEDHEFAQPEYVDWLHSRGILVLLNAMSMTSRIELFCGWDDETSILDSPEHGWGKLMRLGADIIQTDWPEMLLTYIAVSSESSLAERQ